jgi:5,10-methylenetetrahydromethanopterin reductase
MLNGKPPTLGFGVTVHPPVDEHVQLLRRVEELGYARLWVPDERFTRDMGVELTLAAAATERIAIGTAVTNPYTRHPVVLAALMASIDEIANGRLTVGISAGSSGFGSLGLKRVRAYRRVREAVEILRRLWRGETLTLDGAVFALDRAALDFASPRPELPVWIAARGPRLLQLAGETANGVIIGSLASAPTLRYAHANIDRGLRRAGRGTGELTRAIWLHTAIAADADAARDAVRTIVARLLLSTAPVLDDIGVPLPTPMKELLQTPGFDTSDPRFRDVRAALTPDILNHFSAAGTPDEVRARVAEIAATGVEHIAVNPYPVPGQSMLEFAALVADTLT